MCIKGSFATGFKLSAFDVATMNKVSFVTT